MITKSAHHSPVCPPWYYRLAIALARPIYRLLVWKKSRTRTTYQREAAERFGRAFLPVPSAVDNLQNTHDNQAQFGRFSQGLPAGNGRLIWCHAVSLGEINTAFPMLKILLNQGFRLWITSTTQTGFARTAALFADELGKSVNHSFVPVDSAPVVRRFLRHVQPALAVFIETELWATTLYELKRAKIPAVMVNARLSEKSYASYAKFATVSAGMMANLTKIIAQDEKSAERFVALGASDDKVVRAPSLKWAQAGQWSAAHDALYAKVCAWLGVDGNSKISTNANFSNTANPRRPIWVMASTHDTEECLALLAHQKVLSCEPNALLILVPRHPERFDDVAKLCAELGFAPARRAHDDAIKADTQVYLADSMGELLVWYRTADVAVVAGSFVDVGGHNPIEPASFAKPVIMGEFVKNCELLVQKLAQAGALMQVKNTPDELANALLVYLCDQQKAERAGQAGKTLTERYANAAWVQASLTLAVLGDEM
ncbi:3-deoxy-D-manno-octulosonic-acid transferase [Moraxella caviae]|nr:3-deoxy-D-manno-octulosonic acid transferase [Moraxella caviae]STZ10087.1 3-deoxy-D-manno-octulosonic-acid transferase [Moraxella caviae]